ncbi:MAG: c-type cytochrome [Verrucomicrobia bacterium]|nr:c-type cytochrome [Verrucomicrobiota bacterium]
MGPLFDTSPKTTAIDIIGTQAMPEEFQGCAVIGGYFGGVVEVHRFSDAGAGFKTTQLPRVLTSSSNAFRPVDVGIGPDGAIYAADWFNPVIGHYQASYADPMRDRSRGRIWRVSAKGRPAIKQPDLKRMDARQLLEQLKSPERWTRQQAKRRLFHLPTSEVVTAALAWVRSVDVESPDHGRWLIDAAGVLEAHEAPDADLLKRLVHAKDPRVRAYGARVAGAWGDRLPAAKQLLVEKASDPHPRVRLETAVAATYIPHKDSVNMVTRVLDSAMDPFLTYAVRASARALQPFWGPELAAGRLETKAGSTHETYLRKLLGETSAKRAVGEEVYEMACLPCHQPGGRGLAGVYPALAGSDWVMGDPRVLAKIILHGLEGPIQSRGRTLDGTGTIPMPSMAGLTDEQIADVLTFVRSSFGKNATAVRSSDVTRIRTETSERQKPWTQPELESLFPEARR